MKKEKIVVISTCIILTVFFVILFIFGDKIIKNNYNEVEFLDAQHQEINEFALKPDLYNYQEQITEKLSQKQFSEYELDIYYSDVNNYDGFIYPNNNIYCIDVGGSQQHFIDYKLYTFFKDGTFRKNGLLYLSSYTTLIESFLDNQELSGSSNVYKLLLALDKNKDILMSYYESNDPVGFKKEILKLNGGIGNHDTLTILFFQKHNLGVDSIDPYLNQCFDYENEGLFNETNVKPILYKYLLKTE